MLKYSEVGLRASFALLKGDTFSDGVDHTCVPKHVYGILLAVLQGQAQDNPQHLKSERSGKRSCWSYCPHNVDKLQVWNHPSSALLLLLLC